MSAIYERIKEDIKASMKAKSPELIFLRTLDSAIQLKVKGTEEGITDEAVIGVVVKEIKQRKDSVEAFQKGNRQDLVEKEELGIKLFEKYLPKQLTEDEVIVIMEKVIAEIGEVSIKDMGKIMGSVMKLTKGIADGKMVSRLVKWRLSERVK